MTRSLEGQRHTKRDRLCSHLSTGLISSRLQHSGLLSQCYAQECDMANTDNLKSTWIAVRAGAPSCPVEKDLFWDANFSLSAVAPHISDSVVTWLSTAPKAFSLMMLPLMRQSLMTHYLTSIEYKRSTYNSYAERWRIFITDMGMDDEKMQLSLPSQHTFS